uniref:Uncharacterized protein n=1 Tax=Utricularia reniformis TaxID=192314 RepID=A0A1Y0B2A5_9LAMI|nr:hypothetical protein AEK19_MT1285 [Utricularia reniformis]ART31489.1 hypothetical protein AEK19_MT1285 [Utricularia reniformis]
MKAGRIKESRRAGIDRQRRSRFQRREASTQFFVKCWRAASLFPDALPFGESIDCLSAFFGTFQPSTSNWTKRTLFFSCFTLCEKLLVLLRTNLPVN